MSGPREAYEERERRHAAERDRAARDARMVSTLRSLTFLAAFTALVLWNWLSAAGAWVALGACALLVVLFLVLVSRHRRLRARERRAETLRSLAEQGLLRLDRKWAELDAALPAAERREPEVAPDHPYARDLDVFGPASLTRLAGPVTSGLGRRMLRAWLLSPAPRDVLEARQAAVTELAPALGFRLDLAALGRLAPPSEEHATEALVDWAEREPWRSGRWWAEVGAWVLPALVLGLAALEIWHGAPPWWILPLALQIWLLAHVRRRVAPGFGPVEEGAAALQSAAPQLLLMESARWSSAPLTDLGRRLATAGEPAHRSVARLVRLADTVQSRRGMMYELLGPFLLLDVHLGLALERWRARSGRSVRAWLEALAEMEALSALAGLAHDHPDWAMPSREDSPVLRADAIGHPLLRPEACVRNDVEVGPPGTFLFVTGSNMSGKSTLLRAIGTNVVLAGAGAPVCARAFSLPRVTLWTSMRVDDSLVDGVSRFMAELLRVRSIVQAADAASPGGPVVLYLVDEMLQGTNTAERRVAARAVLRHLLGAGAIGSVTSHDLTLADASDLASRRRAFHLREHVEVGENGTRLGFDYVLRPGLATTRNALRLLEAVGLGPIDGDGDASKEHAEPQNEEDT